MADEAKTDVGGRRSRGRAVAWTGAALLLLLPLLAMQLTDQVAWNVGDFAVLGGLLVGVGLTSEVAARKAGTVVYRVAVGLALAAAFALIWVNLAVGVIGTEHDDANLMYGGVLGVGVVGAMIARSRSLGMARAMLATALAQALVAVIALIAGFGSTGPSWPLDILGLTGFFVALWLISAWLFRKAAQQPGAGA